MNIINNFLITYSSSNSVKRLLTELKSAINNKTDKPLYIGVDESHIYADCVKAVFDMKLATDIEPIEIEINNAIDLFERYKDYLKRYENGKIKGLQPASEIQNVEWEHITGWENGQGIQPKHIIKWAYSDNGYFQEQDEDLLMYRPELIAIMHELMIDPNSKRKTDLYKILRAYAKYAFERVNDVKSQQEFMKIREIKSSNSKHTELGKVINELNERARR